MKKLIGSILVAGIFLLSSIVLNPVLAAGLSTEVPDIEKKVKKETTKTSKKSTSKLASADQQLLPDTSSSEADAQSIQNETDEQNPAFNDDCTKEGFDKD